MLEISEIAQWVAYFILASVVGYVGEVIYCSIRQKKMVARGFLFGPYCPIYGVGNVLVLLIVMQTQNNLLVTFLIITLACVTLEYLSSFLIEKLFKIRYWDYSKSDKFNLHGRICLRNALCFGVGGTLIAYTMGPWTFDLVGMIPGPILIVLASIGSVIMLSDFIFSSYAVLKSEKKLKLDFNIDLNAYKDQTEAIKKACKKVLSDIWSEHKESRKKSAKKS